MEKITYENMSFLMRKANTKRIAATIVSWLIFIVPIVIVYIWGNSNGLVNTSEDFASTFLLSTLPGWALSPLITGIAHCAPFWSKMTGLLAVPLPRFIWIPWLVIWFFIVYTCIVFSGMFYMIFNIFRIIFKKPLVLSSEADYYTRKEIYE